MSKTEKVVLAQKVEKRAVDMLNDLVEHYSTPLAKASKGDILTLAIERLYQDTKKYGKKRINVLKR